MAIKSFLQKNTHFFIVLVFLSILTACDFSLVADVTPPPSLQQLSIEQPTVPPVEINEMGVATSTPPSPNTPPQRATSVSSSISLSITGEIINHSTQDLPKDLLVTLHGFDQSVEVYTSQTTVDEMYDMVVGPKPADVVADPVPVETPTESITTPKVPDQLVVSAREAMGSRVIFKVEALKYTENISEAEFRAMLVQDNSNPTFVDLRLVSEGGTFVPDGITRISVTGIAATSLGAQKQHFYGAYKGRWYYAWRLKNSAGWSVWADGNESPKTVHYYIDTMVTSSYADTGPPSGGSVVLASGPQTGTIVAVAARPTTNAKRICQIWFQFKDASKGAWRELDDNAGAAATHYDGSAISHIYDEVAGTLTKASGNYGDAAMYGGLMMVDVRGGAFDKGCCQFIVVTSDQISGATISGLSQLKPAFAPTGGQYADLRIRIVKPPWMWDDTGGDGYLGALGYFPNDYSGNATQGDVSSGSFMSLPFTTPAGYASTNIQCRVWVLTDYSFGDGSVHSGFYASGAPSEQVIIVGAAASTTVDLNFGRIFEITLTCDVTLHVTNGKDGVPFMIIFIQDATGGRTVMLGSSEFTEGKDSAFAIAPEANSRSYVTFSGNAATTKTDVLAPVRGY